MKAVHDLRINQPRRPALRAIAALLVLGVVAVSCGGDDSTATETTNASDPTTTTTEPGSDGGGEASGDREEAIDASEEDVRENVVGPGLSPDDTGDATGYDAYMTVADDSGILEVDVPEEWGEVDGSEGLFGPDVQTFIVTA
jgi:hypothetical protein